MYHGIPTHGQGGGNRGIRAQRFHWDDHDYINLGIPSNPGTVLNRPSGEERSEIYEAEDASLSGVSRIIGKSGYASGGLYEKFSNSSDNNYAEFTVNTNAQGTYSLDFRYNNNTPSAVNMKLKVNGGQPGISLLPPTQALMPTSISTPCIIYSSMPEATRSGYPARAVWPWMR